MALRKDDTVYYKVQLQKLLQQAKNNGLKIVEEDGRVGFIYEFKVSNVIHREQASVDIRKFRITEENIEVKCAICGVLGVTEGMKYIVVRETKDSYTVINNSQQEVSYFKWVFGEQEDEK